MAETSYPCQRCEAGRGPATCHHCGNARCEEHLLLSMHLGEVSETRYGVQMRQGPIMHVTPQGQPLYSQVPVQVPYAVQVPVLVAVTHSGTQAHYPVPDHVGGRPLTAQSREAAIAAWVGSLRACVWCRERAALQAATPILDREDEAARREAARAAEAARNAAAARAARERQDDIAHLRTLISRRQKYGADSDIKRAVTALQKESNSMTVSLPNPPDFLFWAVPLAAVVGGWMLGVNLADVRRNENEDSPLPLICATIALMVVLLVTAVGERTKRARKARRHAAAKALDTRIFNLTNQLGCGEIECGRCAKLELAARSKGSSTTTLLELLHRLEPPSLEAPKRPARTESKAEFDQMVRELHEQTNTRDAADAESP